MLIKQDKKQNLCQVRAQVAVQVRLPWYVVTRIFPKQPFDDENQRDLLIAFIVLAIFISFNHIFLSPFMGRS